MENKPKVKELIEGFLSCPACSQAVYISDYKGLEISPCPKCQTPVFIPFKIKNYWLYKPLGGGGMGSVYQALSEDDSGEYALKVLPRSQNTNQELINSITREGEIGIILGKAPNIAEVVEYGCEEGEYFLASRFVEGTRLDIFISSASHLSERQALDIILQVIDAEIHIVNCGFLYRDIKPENIIIVEDTASVKLFDFGLCMSLEQAANPDPADALEGSPFYLPPERIVAASEGEHSEIYSLGMLLFHMLAGTTYFSQADIKKLLTKHVGALRVASVTNRLKHCSPEIANIIDKMIKRDPNQRYHQLAVLKTELEELCSKAEGYSLKDSKNVPSAAHAKDIPVQGEKKPSKKINLIILLVVLVVVAVGVGSWHTMNYLADKSQRQEILVATASRLGIDQNVKPPDLNMVEVQNLLKETFNREFEKQKEALPPFDESMETGKICQLLSISVSMRKEPKYSVAQLNKMAESAVKKDAQLKLADSQNSFPEEKAMEAVAKELNLTLPVSAPTRTLKEIEKMLEKDSEQAAKEKFSSKEYSEETMAILKKYKSYREGQQVTVLDHAGLKTTGPFNGREGNKIVIGNRKIMLSDIVPEERIKFNEALCARQAADEVKKLKDDFKNKRLEFAKEYVSKIEKEVYRKYGYIQDKNKWVAINELFDSKLNLRKQEFNKQKSLEKKKIEQAVQKSFDKDAFIRNHGYCKIDGKWYSENDAVNQLLKEKKAVFNKQRIGVLAQIRKEIQGKVEKQVYQDNRYIFFEGKWQPAESVLRNETQRALLQLE